MRNAAMFFLGFGVFALGAGATEFYVATNGSDANPGTATAPLRTIQRAADLAQPGDTVTVGPGVYRERVDPPRGGLSDARRIVYQAAPGAKVVITGSEPATNWVEIKPQVWKLTLPNSFFGSFNPYDNLIHGDWFNPLGRPHHTGAVYLNGRWLTEAATLDAVLDPANTNALWYGQVNETNTTLWARFAGVNPNREQVEINARQTVFYPSKTGINFITVRGFTMEHAATPWAPPTAEQIGLIGPHWSKGWIIESNVIRYSICSGISLGKYGDRWDNTSSNTAEGYVGTIKRALAHGWSRQNIGHHIVRDNLISHCEQAGIVGSLGGAFSTITGNVIHDVHVLNWFSGAEMAGIKLHGAVDVTIRHNHIYRTCLGLWLDWMAQGTRISGNLFHDNGRDAFVEVDHGPFLFDNNLFLSRASLLDRSQGGAYAHNLFAGTVASPGYDSRQTPFLEAHSTQIAGFHDNPTGDDRYDNNLFIRSADLGKYDHATLPVHMEGNVFLAGARPCRKEPDPFVAPGFDPKLELSHRSGAYDLTMRIDPAWTKERTRHLVTTSLLGRTVISKLPYEHPDGSPIRLDRDYSGKLRDPANPAPGPFEYTGNGLTTFRIW